MTPAEHYQEAERLLAKVAALETQPGRALAWPAIQVAAAQAHATLACAPSLAYYYTREASR